jgi:hypothetical protein
MDKSRSRCALIWHGAPVSKANYCRFCRDEASHVCQKHNESNLETSVTSCQFSLISVRPGSRKFRMRKGDARSLMQKTIQTRSKIRVQQLHIEQDSLSMRGIQKLLPLEINLLCINALAWVIWARYNVNTSCTIIIMQLHYPVAAWSMHYPTSEFWVADQTIFKDFRIYVISANVGTSYTCRPTQNPQMWSKRIETLLTTKLVNVGVIRYKCVDSTLLERMPAPQLKT